MLMTPPSLVQIVSFSSKSATICWTTSRRILSHWTVESQGTKSLMVMTLNEWTERLRIELLDTVKFPSTLVSGERTVSHHSTFSCMFLAHVSQHRYSAAVKPGVTWGSNCCTDRVSRLPWVCIESNEFPFKFGIMKQQLKFWITLQE